MNRRRYDRYPGGENVRVEVKRGQVIARAHLINISQGGAYVEISGNGISEGEVELILAPSKDNSASKKLTINCSIIPGRQSVIGGQALKFASALAPWEIAAFTGRPRVAGSFELASGDYRHVEDEVRDIQMCRSRLYIGTLGFTGAWFMGAIAASLAGKVEPTLAAIVGLSFPFVVLAIGLGANIEKANAINLRRGFLMALFPYLGNRTAPPGYLGWQALRSRRHECRSRMANGLCPNATDACWKAAVDLARRETEKHHMFSNPLDSFYAFSTTVYLGLFGLVLVTAVAVGLASAPSLRTHPEALAAIGGIATLLLIGLGAKIGAEMKNVRKGKKSVECYACQWQLIIVNCQSRDRVEATDHSTPIGMGQFNLKPLRSPGPESKAAPFTHAKVETVERPGADQTDEQQQAGQVQPEA